MSTSKHASALTINDSKQECQSFDPIICPSTSKCDNDLTQLSVVVHKQACQCTDHHLQLINNVSVIWPSYLSTNEQISDLTQLSVVNKQACQCTDHQHQHQQASFPVIWPNYLSINKQVCQWFDFDPITICMSTSKHASALTINKQVCQWCYPIICPSRFDPIICSPQASTNHLQHITGMLACCLLTNNEFDHWHGACLLMERKLVSQITGTSPSLALACLLTHHCWHASCLSLMDR